MSRKINETLFELMTGIVIAGILIELVDLVVTAVFPEFSGTRVPFAFGFLVGIATALGLSLHMYRSIDRALDMVSGDAEKYMRKAYLTRTGIILAVAGIVTYFQIGYVMAYFLGVLCLKFGAFLQPLIHKMRKKSGR